MELQQLRYAVAIAETGSFTRAAEACHVTQSALSHQVAALERELGARLFVRGPREVRETAAGDALMAQARVALAAVDRARDDVAAAEGVVRGTLRLGVIPTVVAIDVPTTVRAFRERFPEVRVEVTVGSSDEMVAQIGRGELDVALLGLHADVAPVGAAARELRRERLVTIVSRAHRLASRRRLRIAELAGSVFVDFPASSPGRVQTDMAFAAADVPRDVAFEAWHAEHVLGIVAADLAVAMVAPGVAVHSPDVVAIPTTGAPERVEHLAWHPSDPSPAARAFVEILGGPAADPLACSARRSARMDP
ncbi:LysR family transcriptional regulator [Microbacterium sp. G2-8]|uniref:LysR family transcriptional regulator n=1 Tax=Microbacterium sp. G2-8 TaxID=2842454 RepID=UPI001C8A20C2|nr:LysR substrate-binding domain-containing protein [Microbacterium sp. G2-8]